jgi:hypothetical protein
LLTVAAAGARPPCSRPGETGDFAIIGKRPLDYREIECTRAGASPRLNNFRLDK